MIDLFYQLSHDFDRERWGRYSMELESEEIRQMWKDKAVAKEKEFYESFRRNWRQREVDIENMVSEVYDGDNEDTEDNRRMKAKKFKLHPRGKVVQSAVGRNKKREERLRRKEANRVKIEAMKAFLKNNP